MTHKHYVELSVRLRPSSSSRSSACLSPLASPTCHLSPFVNRRWCLPRSERHFLPLTLAFAAPSHFVHHSSLFARRRKVSEISFGTAGNVFRPAAAGRGTRAWTNTHMRARPPSLGHNGLVTLRRAWDKQLWIQCEPLSMSLNAGCVTDAE